MGPDRSPEPAKGRIEDKRGKTKKNILRFAEKLTIKGKKCPQFAEEVVGTGKASPGSVRRGQKGEEAPPGDGPAGKTPPAAAGLSPGTFLAPPAPPWEQHPNQHQHPR